MLGVGVMVCGVIGPGPSGSTTVVVGVSVGDVGLVVSVGLVVDVGLVVVVVVVVVVGVYSGSFGRRTFVRGTQV
jgi:hypothetical protein